MTAKRSTIISDVGDAWTKKLGEASSKWTGVKPKVLIFDINETCIDFETMSPIFEEVFGDGIVMREWLSQLILYSMTASMSGIYVPYFELGAGLFKMVGEIHGKNITDADAQKIAVAMQNMKA